MKIILIISFISLFRIGEVLADAAQNKPEKLQAIEKAEGHEAGKEHHEDHDDHESENDHAEHGEEAEANPQVGEGKGITVASAEDGIKLSPQAIKNFEIETIQVLNVDQIIISKKAVVTAGEEINLFRLRDGFYKRIDFHMIKKENGKITVKSKDLKLNDQIVIRGMGFLRIAEIAAFGGAPEGHSH